MTGVVDRAEQARALLSQARIDEEDDPELYGDRCRESSALRAIEAALSPVPAGGAALEAQLDWFYSKIIPLCEATEDDPDLAAAVAAADASDFTRGFARGSILTAKGIRRAMGEVIRERRSALKSDSATPTEPPSSTALTESGDGE